MTAFSLPTKETTAFRTLLECGGFLCRQRKCSHRGPPRCPSFPASTTVPFPVQCPDTHPLHLPQGKLSRREKGSQTTSQVCTGEGGRRHRTRLTVQNNEKGPAPQLIHLTPHKALSHTLTSPPLSPLSPRYTPEAPLASGTMRWKTTCPSSTSSMRPVQVKRSCRPVVQRRSKPERGCYSIPLGTPSAP